MITQTLERPVEAVIEPAPADQAALILRQFWLEAEEATRPERAPAPDARPVPRPGPGSRVRFAFD